MILPDVNASWRVNDWFRLGVGVYMIAPFGPGSVESSTTFVYTGYLNARFVILFK